MDARWEAPLAVCFFGTPRFRYGDAPLRPAFAKSTLAVLAYVLLNRSAALRRDDVAFALWPDDAESEARANLRRHLYIIARALPRGPQPWILADSRTVAWNPSAPLDLDVELFERYAADPTTRARALALYHGDLLADVAADWLDARRTHYRERFCDVALEAARDAAQSGDHERAVALAQNVLASDPWREEAVRIVIAGRAHAGDRASAFATYLNFERRLRAELEASPMKQTRELYESLARDIPPLVVTGPAHPARPPAPRARRIPGHLSRFIGRESELASVASALESCRLVTLLGAGGVGKSRLAAHVADSRAVRATFPGEPIFIEFATVASDRTAFETKVRDALGITATDEAVVDACARVAEAERALLVFDNVEHVIEIAGRFLVELIARSERVTTLATSRQPLHILGEQIVGVRPLRLPERDADAHAALASESVTLFLDRARTLDANFRIEDDDVAHVAAICRRLDGIPLAIELAAARSNMLGVREIDERLGDRFTLLATRRVDTLRHHQTLRATLDWSYDLLDERERRALRRLAVFKNGWTLEAASEILTLGGSEPIDVFESLARLIDQSLVVVHDGARRRYGYLETIHAYALLRLADSGEEATARAVSSAYFERHVGERFAAFGSHAEKRVFDEIALEHDNVLGVFDEAIGRGDATFGGRLAARLAPFWVTRGFALEARRRVEALLKSEFFLEPPLRGELCNAAAILHYRCGTIVPSLERAEEALAIGLATGDDRIVAGALVAQARCWFSSHELAAATQALERAHAMYERLGDRGEIARTLNFLGMLADNETAIGLHERSLAIYEALGHEQGIATVNYHLSYKAYERAEHEKSIGHATKALEIWRASGNLQGENWASYNIACAEAGLGLRERSLARFLSCIVTAHRRGFGRDLCDGLERLAGLIADDVPEASAGAIGHAMRLRESFGHAMLPNERAGYENLCARLESDLGGESFEAARRAGMAADSGALIESLSALVTLRAFRRPHTLSVSNE